MGDLIQLNEWRANRARPSRDMRPAFYFDLSCPFSYLVIERVERALGDVEWIPAAFNSVGCSHDERELARLRDRAAARATSLRLPLVWPDRFPAHTPCALRAADYAAEIGAGAPFALAASRLAFCGGFDLEDPETLAEAAAAAGVPLDACLHAAGDASRDEALEATATGLRARRIGQLPVVRVGPSWFEGEAGLLAASAMLHRSETYDSPLAPVG